MTDSLPVLLYDGSSDPSLLTDDSPGNVWKYLDTLYVDSYRGYGPFSTPLPQTYVILRNLEKRVSELEAELAKRNNE